MTHDTNADKVSRISDEELAELLSYEGDLYMSRAAQPHLRKVLTELQSRRSTPADMGVSEEQRRQIAFDVKREIRLAFRKALADLPEIAPPEISVLLSSVHMTDEFFAEGKRLQREHGTDAVSPRVEQECAAGAWSFMRQGVRSALSPQPLPEPGDGEWSLLDSREKQFRLWFFRDLSDEQRLGLFTLMGMPKEGLQQLGVQQMAFKHLFAKPTATLTTHEAQEPVTLEVEWVVNEIAELGVKIGNQFFFCYKGYSLTYTAEDGGEVVMMGDGSAPMHWRPVFKREFGECIHPINYKGLTRIGTVSLDDSDEWKPLPAAKTIDAKLELAHPATTVTEARVEAAAKAIHDHWQNAPHGRSWEETVEKLPAQAEDFRAKARTALQAAATVREG